MSDEERRDLGALIDAIVNVTNKLDAHVHEENGLIRELLEKTKSIDASLTSIHKELKPIREARIAKKVVFSSILQAGGIAAALAAIGALIGGLIKVILTWKR